MSDNDIDTLQVDLDSLGVVGGRKCDENKFR
jgi:hypothetical protein